MVGHLVTKMAKRSAVINFVYVGVFLLPSNQVCGFYSGLHLFFFIFMQLYQCCNAYECDYNVPIYVQVQLFCSHGYYRMKLWTTLCKMNFKDQLSEKKLK